MEDSTLAGVIVSLVIILLTGVTAYRALKSGDKKDMALTLTFFLFAFVSVHLTLQKSIYNLKKTVTKDCPRYEDIIAVDKMMKGLANCSTPRCSIFVKILGEEAEFFNSYQNTDIIPFSNTYQALSFLAMCLQRYDSCTTGGRAISIDPKEFEIRAALELDYDKTFARFAHSKLGAKRFYVIPDSLFPTPNDSIVKKFRETHPSLYLSNSLAISQVLYNRIIWYYPQVENHLKDGIQCLAIRQCDFDTAIGRIKPSWQDDVWSYDLILVIQGENPMYLRVMEGACRTAKGYIKYYAPENKLELADLLEKYECIEHSSCAHPILDVSEKEQYMEEAALKAYLK